MKSRFTIWQIVKQTAPVLMSMVLLSIITGSKLNQEFDLISNKEPVLLIALPAFINIAGDLAGVFASRLTTMVYAGRITAKFSPLNLYFVNLLAIVSVSLTAFATVGVAGNILAGVLFQKESAWMPAMLTITLAGLTATITMCLVATGLIRISYTKGLDPDSITSPVCTTGGDLVGTFTLLFLAKIFL